MIRYTSFIVSCCVVMLVGAVLILELSKYSWYLVSNLLISFAEYSSPHGFRTQT